MVDFTVSVFEADAESSYDVKRETNPQLNSKKNSSNWTRARIKQTDCKIMSGGHQRGDTINADRILIHFAPDSVNAEDRNTADNSFIPNRKFQSLDLRKAF